MKTTLIFVLALVSSTVRALDCSPQAVVALVDAVFATTGTDCPLYASLYTNNATYYHQHDGFKVQTQLLENCKNYASFCPGSSCRFLRNGGIMTSQVGERCHILSPYLWSEIPANNKVPGNLEPHTGWEYMIAVANNSSTFSFKLESFAEIETSYSVAYNRGNPQDFSAYGWTLALLKTTASRGECDIPVPPTIYQEIQKMGAGWRQQSEAVVLSVGGLCHVAVPYASQVGFVLNTGVIVFVLQPNGSNYIVRSTVVF